MINILLTLTLLEVIIFSSSWTAARSWMWPFTNRTCTFLSIFSIVKVFISSSAEEPSFNLRTTFLQCATVPRLISINRECKWSVFNAACRIKSWQYIATQLSAQMIHTYHFTALLGALRHLYATTPKLTTIFQ